MNVQASILLRSLFDPSVGLVAAGVALLAVGAGCNQDPTRGTFTEHVGDAFEACVPAEIRFLAGKHNFMTAFAPCGSNNFNDFAWSPDGTHLYFATPLTARIMDAEAEDKRNWAVPTETPAGRAAWLNASRIALPLGPADLEDPDAPERIAVYDIDQRSVFTKPLPDHRGVDQLQRGDDPSELLFVADGPEGRTVYRMNVDDGEVRPAFSWLEAGVDTFAYTPEVRKVVTGRDETVAVHDRDGTEVGTWTPARRGTVSGDGRWLALEHDGPPVSIFYQRAWDELSENARRRELARARRFEERLPDWYPREVEPPTLSMVDLSALGSDSEGAGERWVFTGVFGHGFQWYDARPYYASFILWGFEGKEFNRNVVLGNLADRLRYIGRGEEMMGVTRWGQDHGAAPGEVDPGAPADGAAAKDDTPEKDGAPAKEDAASAE